MLVGNESGLTQILFPDQGSPAQALPHWTENAEAFSAASAQLQAYFDGELKCFDVELAPSGTAFQQSVWTALLRVNYGETVSYKLIAEQIGKPKASRAVGAANGANPIPIIIPCHRIIGSNGALTGFAAGLLTKQWLLAHESGEQSLFNLDEFSD